MANYCKSFFVFLFFCLSVFPFSSCQEGSEAGDLFGQWRMTGSDTQYISFSGSVTLLRNTAEGEVFGNFQHVGDSLFIQCYSIEGEPYDTVIVEDFFGLKPFNNIRLKIENLDNEHLVLNQGDQIWSFYKY
ncbi:MAG: lipocalin-like domain-containing protein [Prevotella sp.]|nr:lipocalin-like domain-containing protein [Prevotella sp.]